MKKALYLAAPLNKPELTLALEAGVDCVLAEPDDLEQIAALARLETIALPDVDFFQLLTKQDEDAAAANLALGRLTILRDGWQVIPVENLLAREQVAGKHGLLALEVLTLEQARLALGILQHGVDLLVLGPQALPQLREIMQLLQGGDQILQLTEAKITEIRPVGLGHRVCVDTLSLYHSGQGMLVGNSAAFTFLVNAETEPNEYVAPRPFRINAGAVHAYAIMPADRTAYLEDLRSGDQILILDSQGRANPATVGRLKKEVRPMLLITAVAGGREGGVFLQNAETVRLVCPGGQTASVVKLKPGDKVLCRLDEAGRHFGLRVSEEITE